MTVCGHNFGEYIYILSNSKAKFINQIYSQKPKSYLKKMRLQTETRSYDYTCLSCLLLLFSLEDLSDEFRESNVTWNTPGIIITFSSDYWLVCFTQMQIIFKDPINSHSYFCVSTSALSFVNYKNIIIIWHTNSFMCILVFQINEYSAAYTKG